MTKIILKNLKQEINNRGLRIGKKELELFSKKIDESILDLIKILERRMVLSGRKNVQKKNIERTFIKK